MAYLGQKPMALVVKPLLTQPPLNTRKNVTKKNRNQTPTRFQHPTKTAEVFLQKIFYFNRAIVCLGMPLKSLVVYYSRTGNTKFVAEQVAAELGAEIQEIVDLKSRAGKLGWMSAGRDATGNRETQIGETEKNLDEFDFVLVGTPVWAWSPSAAVRTYVGKHNFAGKKVALFFTLDNNPRGAVEKTKKLMVGAEFLGDLVLAKPPRTRKQQKRKSASGAAHSRQNFRVSHSGTFGRGIPSISAMTFCNITKNQTEAALSQAPAIQTRNRRQAQTKKTTQNNPLEICLLEGGYPIFTSKSQGKYGLETGGGGLVFVTKNQHKYGFQPRLDQGKVPSFLHQKNKVKMGQLSPDWRRSVSAHALL